PPIPALTLLRKRVVDLPRACTNSQPSPDVFKGGPNSTKRAREDKIRSTPRSVIISDLNVAVNFILRTLIVYRNAVLVEEGYLFEDALTVGVGSPVGKEPYHMRSNHGSTM